MGRNWKAKVPLDRVFVECFARTVQTMATLRSKIQETLETTVEALLGALEVEGMMETDLKTVIPQAGSLAFESITFSV